MTTYTSATITFPDGQRMKLDSFKCSYSEREPVTGEIPRRYSGVIGFDLAHEAKIGAEELAKLAALLRRLRALRVCWKCRDGRTRSHNRRCPRRGHGRNAVSP